MSKNISGVIPTHIATATADTITVRGYDLAEDLMGQINIGDLFFLEVVGRRPNASESALLNAMMVANSEHGMMPGVIAARMTLLGAPESLQGAVASGLLGVGDTFVGASSNVARLLQVDAAKVQGSPLDVARTIVQAHVAERRRIPGLGHPHHPVDPRAEKLLAMQRELGIQDRYVRLMLLIRDEACELLGKHLTFNAVAAIGAVASDLGIDWRAVRGIGLVARTVSLVGHLLEEMKEPSASMMSELVQDNTVYSE